MRENGRLFVTMSLTIAFVNPWLEKTYDIYMMLENLAIILQEEANNVATDFDGWWATISAATF